MHPELKTLDKQLLDNRYKHHEEKRLNKIKLVQEKRRDIINTKPIDSQSKVLNSTLHDNSKSIGLIDPTSTAIRDEQKRLERLKNKQVILVLRVDLGAPKHDRH